MGAIHVSKGAGRQRHPRQDAGVCIWGGSGRSRGDILPQIEFATANFLRE